MPLAEARASDKNAEKGARRCVAIPLMVRAAIGRMPRTDQAADRHTDTQKDTLTHKHTDTHRRKHT